MNALSFFGFLAGLLGILYVIFSHEDAELRAKQPPPVPAADERIWQSGESFWCKMGCLTLKAWDKLSDDQALTQALAIAYHYNVDWRGQAHISVSRRTLISFAEINEKDFGGQFLPSQNKIVIDTSLSKERPDVVAAILAHEVAHSAATWHFSNTREAAAACFDEEIRAMSWEAATWERVPHQGLNLFGYASGEAERARRWRAKSLREEIASSTSYQRECFGRELAPG